MDPSVSGTSSVNQPDISQRAQVLWGKVRTTIVDAWDKVDDVLARFLGLDESKYQWAIDAQRIQQQQEEEAREIALQAVRASSGAEGDAGVSLADVESQVLAVEEIEVQQPLNAQHGMKR